MEQLGVSLCVWCVQVCVDAGLRCRDVKVAQSLKLVESHKCNLLIYTSIKYNALHHGNFCENF